MTHNQISFAAHKENVRHNLVAEQETNRHNVVFEGETKRHNVVTEDETKRSNKANEQIKIDTLAESNRHNLVTEAETQRRNTIDAVQRRQEQEETYRHNTAVEGLQQTKDQFNRWLDERKLNQSGQQLKVQAQQVAADIALKGAQAKKADAEVDYLGNKTVTEYINAIGGTVGNLGKALQSGVQGISGVRDLIGISRQLPLF